MEMMMIVRMQTAPMMFWGFISLNDWQSMPDFEQDIIVNFAKQTLWK